MVDWLKRVLGEGWDVIPAGGLTGDAYFAVKDDKKLFLKRNSSPFLAVLSAEGIVPKLVWTKRMENGDVITAQEWLEGRELSPVEMQHHHVAELLHKIHHSSELLHMLMRLGKKPVSSDESYAMIKARLARANHATNGSEISEALLNLERLLPVTRNQNKVVCHGDLNHNNLLVTKEGDLFLIDWDNAIIADPATDYAMILKWYIPRQDWENWLQNYGVTMDTNTIGRMYWYLLLDALQYLSWHEERKEPDKVQERVENIKELNAQISTSILS
ncbi:phosphotransferase [Virgibacillus xinjiangensis]|uniref:Phosphotransferase n=1 Tax=Virgibacillus xinjiangensis TaxID=393090 RepID=A0ABV7CUR2_9BACI